MNPSNPSYMTVSHRSRQTSDHTADPAYLPTVSTAAYPLASASASASASSALPMTIPGARESVPPPLPPPSQIPHLDAGHDLAWQMSNPALSGGAVPKSIVKPGSSLLGQGSGLHFPPINSTSPSSPHGYTAMPPQNSRMDDSSATQSPSSRLPGQSLVTTPHEETMSTSAVNYRLHSSERQLEQRSLEVSSQSYDKQLLNRLKNVPKPVSYGQSLPPIEAHPFTNSDQSRQELPQLRSIVLPERHSGRAESPRSSRWASESSGAVSPSFSVGGWPAEHGPFGQYPDSATALPSTSLGHDNGNGNNKNNNRNYVSSGNRSNSHNGGTSPHNQQSRRDSSNHPMFGHDDMLEDERHDMNALQINDRRLQQDPRAGVKRRASSPPREAYREDRASVSSVSGDGFSRRMPLYQPGQISPNSRLHPNHSSVSSMSSMGHRHGSLGSSMGPMSMVSSATSLGSGRLSPTSYTSAPRSMLDDRRCPPPPLGDSTTSPHLHALAQAGVHFICECCPKKPKKFESAAELRAHESEKQYSCSYCPNRFKNKNEAERHQNSLHLRRYSWSCAALATVEAAFHTSPSGHEADSCGFCGDEFSNPPQWDVRAEHLNHVHKYGECNQSKKFYRADHFRQHLKHSHAGTSGKWTNMLENACMKEEEEPEKRVINAQSLPTISARPGFATMLSVPHHHTQHMER